MSNEETEWEEWTMDVTFKFTFTTEGPFPVDMPDDERRKMVKEQFENEWGEAFYQAYTSAQRHRLETEEPEKYEL